MKTLNELKKALKAINARIEKVTAEIKTLTLENELMDAYTRHSIAIENHNRDEALKAVEDLKAIHKNMEDPARKKAIEQANSRLFDLNLMGAIIRDNCKVAFFNECYPILVKAFEPYEGKSYGEKTQEKIYTACKEHGFVYNISRSWCGVELTIQELDNNGYTFPGGRKIEVWGTRLTADDNGKERIISSAFLTDDNKIHFDGIIPKISAKYTEDPAKKAREIRKAYKAMEKITRERETLRTELTELLPSGVKAPDITPDYIIRF